MAAPGRRSRPALIQRLLKEPFRFAFFQAVRILELAARRDAANTRFVARQPVGEDADPVAEVVRFQAHQTLAFAATEIADYRLPDLAEGEQQRRVQPPPAMRANVMGLTGPMGVLPYHYTETVIRGIRMRSTALRDFLDMFNHRAMSLFYRAWAKYRLAPSYERTGDGTDDISQSLFALVGLGTAQLRGRMDFDDELAAHYGGFLSHMPRSAIGLERMLTHAFGQPVRVEQFAGRWLALGVEERTRLSVSPDGGGHFSQLGVSAVIGERVWDVQGSFRLHLGPLDYRQFLRFMPAGGELRQLAQLTQLYVGPDLMFDVRLRLRRDAVPDLLMVDDPGAGPRLGWNTWLKEGPMAEDRDDSIFQVSIL